MVVQLTSEGKLLTLFLNESPIGEKHSTMCKFCLQRSTKKLKSWAGVPSGHLFYSFAIFLTES